METLCTEIKDLKKNQMEVLELKSTVTKIKSSVDGLNSKMEGTGEVISDLEDRLETIQSEQLRESRI